jgi:hypothetical protein
MQKLLLLTYFAGLGLIALPLLSAVTLHNPSYSFLGLLGAVVAGIGWLGWSLFEQIKLKFPRQYP